MSDDEKVLTAKEIIKIQNSYKDDTAEKFILDLYEKNNYRLCVTEELYLETCKQNNIATTNEFLKFLVLKNYIRKKSDSKSLDKAEDLYSDEILNEYVNQLKEENEKLQAEVESAQSDHEYIEKLARERLGLIKDGEQVIESLEP